MPAKACETREVLIVGGGIVGCAAAYYLARRGASVTIFERGDVASEQSSRAWGFIRQQGRHTAEAPLAAEASRLWTTLEQDLGTDIEFVRSGILVTAETEADEARLAAAMVTAKDHGIGSRMVGMEEIKTLVPSAPPFWRTGLYTSEDGHADPAKTTCAFAAAARRLGVKIHERTPVVGIELRDNRITGIVTQEAVHKGTTVLCAAGIGTAELSRTLGVALPIKTVRANVAQTNSAGIGFSTAVWSPQVALRPKRDGSFVLGNGYRGIDAEFDVTLDAFRDLPQFLPTLWLNRHIVRLRFGAPFFEDLRRRLGGSQRFVPWSEPVPNVDLIRYNEARFYDAFPHLAGLGLRRAWAGRVDATPDLIPIIGGVDRLAGFYVAAGFNGHGFALSPAVGKVLAELILDQKPSVDLHAFRWTRFAEGDVRPQSNAL